MSLRLTRAVTTPENTEVTVEITISNTLPIPDVKISKIFVRFDFQSMLASSAIISSGRICVFCSHLIAELKRGGTSAMMISIHFTS